MESLKLDGVKPELKAIIQPYLVKLLEIHKENIISVALYGSATGKYFMPKKSDINLAVVFEKLEFQQLKNSLKLINYGMSRRITAPLFLSLSHIESSKDTFPVEFIEIKENNVLLYGRDIFSGLKIDETHIRLFCKRDIEGKIIRLRQAYLEIGLKRKGVEVLMKESMHSLMPVFRALLRSKVQNPPVDKEEILVEFCSHYGLAKDVFIAIFKDRMNDEKIKGEDAEVFFEKYLKEIEKIS
jgi:predicted nucleotidyltransferase